MIRRRLLLDDSPPLQPPPSPSGVSNDDVGSNILITVLILAIAVILSASLYLLLRFLRRRNHHQNTQSLSSTSSPPPIQQQQQQQQPPSRRKISPSINDPLIDTLPLFTFDSISTAGDCAVCLSKFEPKDLLRLLPICCHAFHSDCIDTWLNSNQSCPLCRSPVFVPESELLSKLDNPNANPNPARISSSTGGSGSFRVEIGNVSQRNSGEVNPVHRSYSLGGNFEYIVDNDVVSEVHSGSFRRTFSTEFKLDDQAALHNQQGVLAAEVGTRGGGVGGGGGWLKEYLSHSLSSSFRSSGRWFFTGSSRREFNVDNIGGENGHNNNNNRVSELDVEASRLGEEIGELFRWLSGV